MQVNFQVNANLPYVFQSIPDLTNLMELERMIVGRGTEQVVPPLNL